MDHVEIGQCFKQFPKEFIEKTTFTNNSFVNYRWSNNCNTYERPNYIVDNN